MTIVDIIKIKHIINIKIFGEINIEKIDNMILRIIRVFGELSDTFSNLLFLQIGQFVLLFS
ncbi:hypothetical protein, partial [Staphylococcus aureus]|uniref:hypothetical protein n=1 Tax=Staphylococcus aureus TaxID=1280 RepID=UPI001C6ED018